jgi:hypothetical protein
MEPRSANTSHKTRTQAKVIGSLLSVLAKPTYVYGYGTTAYLLKS